MWAVKGSDGALRSRTADCSPISAGIAASALREVRHRRSHRVMAMVGISCAALLAGLGAAAPAAASANRGNGAAGTSCTGWTDLQPPNPGTYNVLNDVDVLSTTNAWAAGSFDPLNGDPTSSLVEHWDGSAWKATLLFPGVFSGVAAASPTSVWAVGYRRHGRTLIVHWNGAGWRELDPSPRGGLYDVAAISPANVWTVGSLIMHWNGKGWKQLRIPVSVGVLLGVAASSPTQIWAVGTSGSTDNRTLVLHWNGTKWKRVPSPNPAGALPGNLNVLDSVTVISRNNVWAAGYDASPTDGPRKTLIEHWNGRRWKHVASPSPGDSVGLGSVLTGVAGTSASNVWAVGEYSSGTAELSLTARWNGKTWEQVASPNLGGTTTYARNRLKAVAATSASNVWAVGSWSGQAGSGALAIHRC